MYYYDSFWDSFLGTYLWSAIIGGLIWGLIWGFVTKKVNESRGYYGGFAWGFFLGIIGLIVVLCKSDNTTTTRVKETPYYMRESEEKATLSNGGWKCSRCGRANERYVGTCVCGMSKTENEAKARAAVQAAQEKAKNDSEQQNLQKLKSYKELLDSGVITQEEFDAKKKEILKL